MALLQYDFLVRALLASLLVGLTAPMVGIYLVQRRLALIGDGLGHVALTGVALGVLTRTAPVGTALVCAVLGAAAIEVIRSRGRASADVALAVMFYGGIAGGVVLIGLSKQSSPATLSSYLFGSIVTTTTGDVVVFAALSAVVVLLSVGLAPRLFAVSNDEEYARASGMHVLGLNLLLAVLTAATVVVSMRVVGLLLISALMILPNAVAQVVATSFRGSLSTAVAVGVVVSVGGTSASFYLDTAPGGTIVLLAILTFLIASVGAAVNRTVHGRRAHSDGEHRHEHGPGCGHEAVAHGDHVDYVHDGHRHAAHGAHYDDH
jgi:zinc transport system permease protein